MKLLFTLLFALFCLAATAQGLPSDPTTGKVVYAGVAQIPASVTPAQAFGRAKVWLSDAFTGHAVLTEDAASGLLSGGGVVPVKNFNYSFRVRLQVEPAAVRYRLDNFTWLYTEPGSPTDNGTVEAQRDSKLGIGKNSRAKMLAELDAQVRVGLAQLEKELAGTL